VKPGDIEVRQVLIGGQSLQVAIRHGAGNQPPLLMFNGIGANWELAKPFLEALTHTTAIIFDVPGVGGSPVPSVPYRPSTLARLAAGLVAELGHSEIDVAGVSWGGGVAQQFAHQYPKLCRRLVLAATSPGAIMVPAGPSVLWKMATPRRYTDKDYMSKVAPEIYGGDFRKNPSLIGAHASAMRGARNLGYFYQLLAMTGWTSLPWLWSLPQPTLILMGSDDPLVPPINGRILALLIANAHRVEFPFNLAFPKVKEAMKLGEFRSEVIFLPDIALQQHGMIRPMIKDLGGRQPITIQLLCERHHLSLSDSS